MSDEFSIKLEQTPRGFERGEFTDLYGWACSIQESSLASQDAIWLGCDRDADGNPVGPIDPLTQQCIGGRMHLNRDMVAALLPFLQYFVETGILPRVTPDAEEESND